MPTKILDSTDARNQWGEVLEQVRTGSSDVVISRYARPVAVLIPAEDYEALRDELEDIRLARLAQSIYDQYKTGTLKTRPLGEVAEELYEEQ